jgi:hypothetical protein
VASKGSNRKINRSGKRTRNSADKSEHQTNDSPVVLDDVEIQSRVCTLICSGKSIREVQKELASGNPSVQLTRQQPYTILKNAAKRGRIRYVAPIESELSLSFRNRYDWLHSTEVVHTAEVADIAEHASEKLLDLIGGSRSGGQPKEEFHIGFAGGGLLQHTARLLADKLRRTTRRLPKTLYFHSMVARFDEDPASDPNSFVGYLNSNPPIPVAVRFIGLMAPGIVDVSTAMKLRKMEGIREAYNRVSELDVVVTSAGGHWKTGCSRLHEMYLEKGHEALLARLDQEGCLGDLMWRPFGAKGPIDLKSGIRAMTLVELADLPKLITQRKWVLLVLGRCVNCGNPKTEILRALLNQQHPFITDLVVDSITARSVMSIAT